MIRNKVALVTSMILLGICMLILLVKGLKKYHLLSMGVVLITFALLPILLMTIYQETFARGIMAISYTENGECQMPI